MKKLNNISIFLSFFGVCFALLGFLMSLEQRGFHGITVWFQFPALIFCFCIFCLIFIDYLKNNYGIFR